MLLCKNKCFYIGFEKYLVIHTSEENGKFWTKRLFSYLMFSHLFCSLNRNLQLRKFWKIIAFKKISGIGYFVGLTLCKNALRNEFK